MMDTMRTAFNFGTHKTLRHWFPRHMGKGMRQIRALLHKIDCVIELHDCRIPFSGRNPFLTEALYSKPRLLVLNKVDLAQPSEKEMDLLHMRMQGEEVNDYILAKCLPGESGSIDPSIDEIVPRCIELVNQTGRYSREGSNAIDMLIVGVPNVGKSSLINTIRRKYLRKAAIQRMVGKSPGHTRSVMYKIKVCENPLVHLYDTPGILEPNISDLHCGMKLAMCNTVKDHVMGATMIADYLLFVLNQKKKFKYVDRYGLKQPNDEIREVLLHIALTNRKLQVRKVFTGTGSQLVKIPDYDYSANLMLKDFQEGHLGRFIVDDL